MIAETIQLSLVPAFLLVATGSFLNVVTGRLARVVDRARDLQQRYAETEGLEHERVVRELRRLDRRMDVINWSIALCVACAIVVCIMVAMLFAVGNGRNDLAYAVAAAFITAMLLLTAGLIAFLVEVRLAIQTIPLPAFAPSRLGVSPFPASLHPSRSTDFAANRLPPARYLVFLPNKHAHLLLPSHCRRAHRRAQGARPSLAPAHRRDPDGR
jgi:hypothetical protein